MTSEAPRALIPEFEVQAFFDDLFPEGWTRIGIGRLLGVDRITVARWISGGMPVAKARELVGIRMTEHGRSMKKLIEIAEAYKV